MTEKMTTRLVSVSREALLPFLGYMSQKESKMVGMPGIFTLGAVTDFGQGEMGSGILMFSVDGECATVITLAVYKNTQEILDALMDEFARIMLAASVDQARLSIEDGGAADLAAGYLGQEFLGYTGSEGSEDVFFLVKSGLADMVSKNVVDDRLLCNIPKSVSGYREFTTEIARLSELNKSESRVLFDFLSEKKKDLLSLDVEDALTLSDRELSYAWIGDKGVEGVLLVRIFMGGIYPLFFHGDPTRVGRALIAEAYVRAMDLLPPKDTRVILSGKPGKKILDAVKADS